MRALPALAAVALLAAACDGRGAAEPAAADLPPLVPRATGAASATTDAPPLAPPRADVAGVPGFEIDARLLFEGAPDRPHRLLFTCAFPERVRWELTREDDPLAARVVEYRTGPRVFSLDENRSASRELEGAERDAALRRMELRLATLFWPDGAAWSAEGDAQVAPVRATRGAPVIGSLRASAPVDGRPTLFEVLDPSGGVQERLTVESWQSAGGRAWPRAMRLELPGRPIWTEEVESVRVPAEHADLTFLPVDRHELLGLGPEVGALTLPARVQRAFELQGEPDWEEAIARAGEQAERERAALAARGLELSSALQLELDDGGRPRACVLQLASPADPPPAGWTRRPASRALHTSVPTLEDVDAALLDVLRRALPEGWSPLRPYLRLRPAAGGSWSLSLVLPAVPG